MELESLKQHWNAFGEQDPLWAILTAPGKRGGAWDIEEFFATGRPEVEEVLAVLAGNGPAVDRGRALDFGCGVGRLTQALAEHFESCDGVDVAASMIEQARQLNKNGERVRFHHNDAPDLRMFEDETFDFVLSLIVLQHMVPELMRGYIREFVRVLRPGGVAFFNIPERYVRGEELPSPAWNASLRLIESVPPVAPHEIVTVRLTARNESPVSWPAAAQLRAGDHWLTAKGHVVAFDDARTLLEGDIGPGEEREVQLDVVAPDQPGQYVLEFDLVQEWIGWFASRGSPTLRVPVIVAGTAPVEAPTPAPTEDGEAAVARAGGDAVEAAAPARGEVDDPDEHFLPTMEMHVMSPGEVIATVQEAGGQVLKVMPRDRCGPAIPSLDYIVARPVAEPQPAVLGDRAAQQPTRRRELHRVADDRADLVRFALTSERGSLGRATVAVRTVLRRALIQILHRQTEFNRATSELISELERQVDGLTAETVAQRQDLAAAQRRIARLEADALMREHRAQRDPPAPD